MQVDGEVTRRKTLAAPAKETSDRRPMRALILDGDAARETRDFDEVAAAHAHGKRFWLSLDARSGDADKFLDGVLRIHPLAVEDMWNDIGIPKVEDFEEYVQIVMHGIREEDRDGQDLPLALAELDVIIGRNFIATRAHDEQVCAVAPVLNDKARVARLLKRGPAWVAHAVLDRLVDEYLPLIDRFTDRMEQIESGILAARTPKTDGTSMREILRIKRSLQMLRRVAVYQRPGRETIRCGARRPFVVVAASAIEMHPRVAAIDSEFALMDAHFAKQAWERIGGTGHDGDARDVAFVARLRQAKVADRRLAARHLAQHEPPAPLSDLHDERNELASWNVHETEPSVRVGRGDPKRRYRGSSQRLQFAPIGSAARGSFGT